MKRSTFLSGLLLWAALRGTAGGQDSPAPANLAVNPGFEEPAASASATPAGWTLFTSKATDVALTTDAKHSGVQSARMTAQKLPKAYQGISQKLTVQPGENFSFNVFVMNDKANPLGGSAHVQLAVEWYDAAGKEISREYSAKATHALTRMRWEILSLRSVTAPPRADTAIFGIHFSEGPDGGKGAILVDDASIEKRD